MPSINMIAAKRADKKRLESNVRRLMAIILALIIGGVVVGGVFMVCIYNTRSRISDLDVQLARLQPIVDQIETYEKATAKLGPKLDVLSGAKTDTLRWYSMLAKLSEALPTDTWLTRVSSANSTAAAQQSGGTGAITVNLNGVSVNQNQVGEAMLRLNTYPDFEKVDLHYTQKALIGVRQAVEFEIAAAMKNKEQAKEGTEDGSAKS